MQYRLSFCFLLLLLNSFVSNCQSLNNEVISAASGSAQNSQSSLNWIIGEPISETFVGASAILSQGFYQPQLMVGIVNDFLQDNSIQVFPNPTSDFIIITSNHPKHITYKMYDASGKLIATELINTSEKKIAMTNLCQGNYLLSLMDEHTKTLKTFTIIKKD